MRLQCGSPPAPQWLHVSPLTPRAPPTPHPPTSPARARAADQAIEDLRVKYERKAAAEAAAAAKAAAEEKAQEPPREREADWAFEGDSELEQLRMVRSRDGVAGEGWVG